MAAELTHVDDFVESKMKSEYVKETDEAPTDHMDCDNRL
jgi:hypothetical protein